MEASLLFHQLFETMEVIYSIALTGHIISGMTALIAGLAAIILKKGAKLHRITGITFFYSMLTVCATALFISVLKHHVFLLHIGIFAFFMTYSGYRSVKNNTLKPNILDWTILLIALINSVLMIYSGIVILMVFGAIGCYLTISDFRLFTLVLRRKELKKNQWLLRHIGMMLGAYISTSTAFLVVNITQVKSPILLWLAPTIIGVPLIVYWTMRYSSK